MPRNNNTTNTNKFSYFSDPVHFLSLNASEDSRYRIWPYVWRSRGVGHNILGIATQCSLNNMKDVLSITKYWFGPVSLTVFVQGDEMVSFKRKLNYLVRCHPAIADRVSIHLVFPISRPPPIATILDVSDNIDPHICSTYTEETTSRRANYDNIRVPYPVNLLRNIAVKNMHSKYVLVLDVDMIPSPNLLDEVTNSHILKENDELNALVVPAFEIRTGSALPVAKHQLIHMWTNDIVRPFYNDVCWKCQKYTQYDKWKSSGFPYEVVWHDPWEPFYVVRRSLVRYDERFEQYGFNRISQLCHMHMQGARFHVSQNTFLLHSGFKSKSSFHSSKDVENEKNKVIYRRVKMELLQKYPNFGRHC